MPLPVIFKFLTDTSGTRFDEVTDGLDGVKVSSQKAGQAVRSFTSVLRSGQEPVTALADSFSNLTRAFGLGVGATIAVVGVVEVIKSLTAESEKLNSVSDQINSTLKTFQESAGSLDLGGAITQVKTLGKAFEDARTKLGQRTDILGKVGTTIADTFFGGSRERAEAGLESLKAAQGQARFAASVALDKRIEAVEAGKVSKFAAETLAITEKYAKERRQAVDAGLIESDLRKLDILEIEELTKVARKEIDERGKAIQEQLDQEKQATQRINELRIRDEEKIKNLRREGTSELLKGIESLNKSRLAGATPLLNRLVSSAETLGIRGVRESVEQGRRKGEVGNAKALFERFGITERDITARGDAVLISTRKVFLIGCNRDRSKKPRR
jgi:vacuolar-type H+-ATPase subunit I/STV1